MVDQKVFQVPHLFKIVAFILAIGMPLYFQQLMAETIRMGYLDLGPHQYSDSQSGEARGASITCFEAVARKMGYKVQWVGPLPFNRMMAYLEKGRDLDGMPQMIQTPERRKFLFFSKNYFYAAKPNFIVRRDHPLEKINTIGDVKNFVIGQFPKVAISRFVKENYALFRFEFILPGQHKFEQQINKLIVGRIDAIHTLEHYALFYQAKQLKMDHHLKVLLLPENPMPLYTVFTKTPKGRILVEKFDAVFHQVKCGSEDYDILVEKELQVLSSR